MFDRPPVIPPPNESEGMLHVPRVTEEDARLVRQAEGTGSACDEDGPSIAPCGRARAATPGVVGRYR